MNSGESMKRGPAAEKLRWKDVEMPKNADEFVKALNHAIRYDKEVSGILMWAAVETMSDPVEISKLVENYATSYAEINPDNLPNPRNVVISLFKSWAGQVGNQAWSDIMDTYELDAIRGE